MPLRIGKVKKMNKNESKLWMIGLLIIAGLGILVGCSNQSKEWFGIYPDKTPEYPPRILALRATPTEIEPGGIVELSVAAIDTGKFPWDGNNYVQPVDPDKMTYKWTSDHGRFISPDNYVTGWVSPDVPGLYEIHVRVTKRNLFDTESIIITVFEGEKDG